jgi:ankyrin repeat protein
LAVSLFLEAGISIDGRYETDDRCGDCWSRTALMEAAYEGHVSVVKLLLKKGANPNLYSGFGAIYPLMYAAIRGHVEVARTLIQHGANLESENIDSETALIFATENNHTNVVRVLLEAGASSNQEGWSRVPLLSAIYNENITIVDLLLEHSADPNHKSERGGWTPLMAAASVGGIDFLELSSRAKRFVK